MADKPDEKPKDDDAAGTAGATGKTTAGAGGDDPDAVAKQTHYSSQNPGVVALAIYLLLVTAVSVMFLAVLMRADTRASYSEDGNLNANCNAGSFDNHGNANESKNSNNSANGSVNSNASPANGNAYSGNSNAANSSTDANGNSNSNAANKTNTAAKTQAPTNANTSTNKEKSTNGNTNTANGSAGKVINTQVPEMSIPPDVCSMVFGLLTADAFVFLTVFFAGALGACIRGVYSFTTHLGFGTFSFKWTWYYLLLPLVGGALSLGIYFVLRGGFYGASFGKGVSLNIYSFAAFSVLTGLFTSNAIEKLREVAVTILADTPPKVENPAEVLKKKNADAGK